MFTITPSAGRDGFSDRRARPLTTRMVDGNTANIRRPVEGGDAVRGSALFHHDGIRPMGQLNKSDITSAELKAAYTRGNLWMLGKSYDDAIANPTLLKSMQMDVIDHRKKDSQAIQRSFMFDMTPQQIINIKEAA